MRVEEMLNIPSIEFEFLKICHELDIKYLIIGGYAVRFHGYLRDADDLDILSGYDEENARLLKKAIERLIGSQPQITIEELSKPNKRIGLKKSYYEIDILTTIEGVEFDGAFQRGITTTSNGITLRIISKDDLLNHKRISQREKDKKDIDELKKLHNKSL